MENHMVLMKSLLKKMIGKRDLYGRKRVQIVTSHLKSKVLSGYMIFVNRVRENLEKQKTFVQNETERDDTEYMEDLENAHRYLINRWLQKGKIYQKLQMIWENQRSM